MNYLMKNNYVIPKELIQDILVLLKKDNSSLYFELKGEVDNWQEEKVDIKYIMSSKPYWSSNFKITKVNERLWEVKYLANYKVVDCSTELMAYKIALTCQEILMNEPKLIYRFRNYHRFSSKVSYLLGSKSLRYLKR